jgi:predicted RNA binding protein YcfA (HicA-like mRNA interferase family)
MQAEIARTKKISLAGLRNCVYSIHMTSRELLSILTADGWAKVAQKGSHVQLKHPTKKGRVTVPHPRKDIPLGTVLSVLRQAGLDKELAK